MLARTYRNLQPYDAAVCQLRDYFGYLSEKGTNWPCPPRRGGAKPRQANSRKRKP
jgi:hypothetical protein